MGRSLGDGLRLPLSDELLESEFEECFFGTGCSLLVLFSLGILSVGVSSLSSFFIAFWAYELKMSLSGGSLRLTLYIRLFLTSHKNSNR